LIIRGEESADAFLQCLISRETAATLEATL
jgi:hypothetical protein